MPSKYSGGSRVNIVRGMSIAIALVEKFGHALCRLGKTVGALAGIADQPTAAVGLSLVEGS